ncbi:MAG: hypothetical protein Q8O89_03570 [Nanoarchaeota archaeon]|nr:hypothetical protein [Nanoarchaeota archaeon]
MERINAIKFSFTQAAITLFISGLLYLMQRAYYPEKCSTYLGMAVAFIITIIFFLIGIVSCIMHDKLAKKTKLKGAYSIILIEFVMAFIVILTFALIQLAGMYDVLKVAAFAAVLMLIVSGFASLISFKLFKFNQTEAFDKKYNIEISIALVASMILMFLLSYVYVTNKALCGI